MTHFGKKLNSNLNMEHIVESATFINQSHNYNSIGSTQPYPFWVKTVSLVFRKMRTKFSDLFSHKSILLTEWYIYKDLKKKLESIFCGHMLWKRIRSEIICSNSVINEHFQKILGYEFIPNPLCDPPTIHWVLSHSFAVAYHKEFDFKLNNLVVECSGSITFSIMNFDGEKILIELTVL